MSETTLLIDGDVIAFRAAAAVQEVEDDGFGYLRPFANIAQGEAAVENTLLSLQAHLGATHIRVVLSDPHANWRMDICPTYKGNRTDAARPLLLGRLKDFLREKFHAFHWSGLEADDTLGILMTEPQEYPGRRILVGKDKDFKSIPGLHFTVGDFLPSGKPNVREIGEWDAVRFHLIQSLAGDRIDGYAGCNGIGMERAARIIDEPHILTPDVGVVTRGPRKGEKTTKWVSEPSTDYWRVVVSQYLKAGQSEEDALLTARLANILHHDQYDRDTETITLWTPERIKGDQ